MHSPDTSSRPEPVLCAIDAQISPLVPGGTETHTVLQIDALARHSKERFLVMGLKDHAELLRPFIGANMELMAYPVYYHWYREGVPDRYNPSPGWKRLLRHSGPFRDVVREMMRRYAEGEPLSPQAQGLQRLLGPLGGAVPPLWRLQHGLKHKTPAHLSAAENDAMLARYGAKVVHFPYPNHFETRLPFVYEPWGLPHYHLPEIYTPDQIAWIDGLFRDGCERAAMVITGTRWVKEDLMRHYGLPSSKIAVLPRIPVFEDPTQPDGPEDALGDVPERFALFPGVTWDSKNHLGLVRAMARLRDKYGIRMNLVCTGRTVNPAFPLIEKEIAKFGLGDQVRFLGRISRTRLNRLFEKAEFLVHPSKFEGLGLPLVEALHFGLPIVASNAACIPEVLADAAILFDPDDIPAMTKALRKAMTQPHLLADLKARGQRRLKEYFPDHEGLAARFVAVYKRAGRLPMNDEERALIKELTA
jgi:glycosyltransferase involved in cell wall biosynthesis